MFIGYKLHKLLGKKRVNVIFMLQFVFLLIFKEKVKYSKFALEFRSRHFEVCFLCLIIFRIEKCMLNLYCLQFFDGKTTIFQICWEKFLIQAT